MLENLHCILGNYMVHLNSLWWDKNISLDTKKRLGKAVVESVACYGCEVWLKTEEQRKLLALEMDYLRRSARVSRLQKIPNTAIRNKMQAEQSILDRIQRRQLKWYGHLLLGRRRFTSGHRTVGEEEEDRNYHGGTK